MKNDSFVSLLILLVLFFALPTLFKLLGRYTLGSKELEKREHTDEETGPQPPRETIAGHPEKIQPMRHPEEETGRTVINNEPIRPKWF